MKRLRWLALPAFVGVLIWCARSQPERPPLRVAPPPPAAHPLCSLCGEGPWCGDCPDPAAVEPLLLADFRRGEDARFPGAPAALADDGPAARLAAGAYLEANADTGLPADVRAYDWLHLRVFNPGGEPQPLDVEINDAASTGYASRVNFDAVANPGWSSLWVPLDVAVGERGTIGARRVLDRSRLRRLVVSAARAARDVFLTTITLEAEAPLPPASVVAFDAGPGPLLPGLHRFEGEPYTAARGFGLLEGARVLRAEDRRYPEPLTRDWVSIEGTLGVDLPPGRYAVWLMLRDPGYWARVDAFARRTVRAEGEVVHDAHGDAETFAADYLRHADREDHAGSDRWAAYVEPRDRPLRFEVDVRDGRLDLEFAGDGPYAHPLSALIVSPIDDAGAFERWWAAVDERRRRFYARSHPESRPARGPRPEVDRVLFARPPEVDVSAHERPTPGERVEALHLALARGQTAPLTVSLWSGTGAHIDAASLDLPGLDVEAFAVREKARRRRPGGRVWSVAPRLLDPLATPLELTADRSRRLWFRVRAPAAHPGGDVRGVLRLTVSGAVETRPVIVTVHPFELPRTAQWVGWLGAVPTWPPTPFGDVEARRRAGFDRALALLVEAGFTAVSGGLGGPRGADDLGDALASLRAYAGRFDVAFTYLGLEPREGAPLTALVGRSPAGAPPLYHVVGDEPSVDALPEVVARSRSIRAAGGQTAAFVSMQGPTDPRLALVGQVDLLLIDHHDAAALHALARLKQPFALYNQDDRLRRGLYLLRLRALGGRGHLQFAFSSVHADPYDALDGREDDLAAVFVHPDGLRRTLDLERATLALDDLRVFEGLERAVAAAPPSDARAAAAKFIDRTLAAIPLGHRPAALDLDALRAEALRHWTVLRP